MSGYRWDYYCKSIANFRTITILICYDKDKLLSGHKTGTEGRNIPRENSRERKRKKLPPERGDDFGTIGMDRGRILKEGSKR